MVHKCKASASRYLMPMEMYMGVIGIGIGAAGPLGGGVLFSYLQETGQALLWLFGFATTGALQFGFAFYEWHEKNMVRKWDDCRYFHYITWRARVSLLVLTAWVVGTGLVLIMCVETGVVIALTLILPINCAFAFWSYKENSISRDALNPNIRTSGLIPAR